MTNSVKESYSVKEMRKLGVNWRGEDWVSEADYTQAVANDAARKETNQPTNYHRWIAYAKENLAAARIILADAEKYMAGRMGRWAHWARIQVNRCK